MTSSSHADWCNTQRVIRPGELAERGPCNCDGWPKLKKLEQVGWKKVYTRTTYQAKCLACGETAELTVNDAMHLPKHPFCSYSCEKEYCK